MGGIKRTFRKRSLPTISYKSDTSAQKCSVGRNIINKDCKLLRKQMYEKRRVFKFYRITIRKVE
jgi:hypothetical protein